MFYTLPERKKTLDLKYNVSECALDMHWNVEFDTLGYKISMQDTPLTLCVFLSFITSLFDPYKVNMVWHSGAFRFASFL